MEEGGPKVPLISKPFSFACRGVRLARATSGPTGSIIGPTSESEGVAPSSDSGEEVTLGVSCKIAWLDIFNGPFINIARGNMVRRNQVAKPSSDEWIDFVVVGGHVVSDYPRSRPTTIRLRADRRGSGARLR
jgi:hypothetical protein